MKICIEGNIGCGKSTIISRLCQETRLPVFLEPVEDWSEWLSLFYKDPARWGMAFNVKVLMSFNKWKNNEFKAIYERSPLSNRHVFCQLQHDRGQVNALEIDLFDELYQKLAWTPDTIIYIKTDPTTSMERMQKRGRCCESEVPLEYLQAVHDKYEDVIGKFQDKTITIDGNRPAEEVYQDVVRIVRKLINQDK